MAGPTARQVFTDPRYLVAFGLGSGLAPRAPGTAGSVVGLVLFLPLLSLSWTWQLAVILAVFILGTWVSGSVAAELETKDPGGIVIDEFVGMWITLLWLPTPSWFWLLVAFVLFRLFDITKPWPVSLADRELTGGLGIMTDDVIAGLYALVSLQLTWQAYLHLFAPAG